MKKALVLVAAVALCGQIVFAERSREIGLKLGSLTNAGTKLANEDSFEDAKRKVTEGVDVGMYWHIGFGDAEKCAFSIQPEVFFSFLNGVKYEMDGEWGSVSDEFNYTSLDLALLFGCDIPVGKFSIRPFLGPKVGIPIGKMQDYFVIKLKGSSNDIEESKYKMTGATIGLDFGVGFAIPLGNFMLGADIRYGIDFNKVKTKTIMAVPDEEDTSAYRIIEDETKVLRRGALGINVTAGWRF